MLAITVCTVNSVGHVIFVVMWVFACGWFKCLLACGFGCFDLLVGCVVLFGG